VTALCDAHVGEAHPPRCGACDSLTTEYAALGITDSPPGAVTSPAKQSVQTPVPEIGTIQLAAKSPEETAMEYLVAMWATWQPAGSILDQLGTSETVRVFRSHGPFTANLHHWADNTGVAVSVESAGDTGAIPELYRGAVPSGRNGMSWTDSVMYALQYAWDSDGQIFTCAFESSDFLARIRHTREDNPGDDHYEWIMAPTGQASLWVPRWIPDPTPEAVAADHERMKRECERLSWPDGEVPTPMRPRKGNHMAEIRNPGAEVTGI
jgi:hypothetical protein